MDFWTRLIGGGLSTSRSSRRNVAGQRLTRFKQISNALYQIWRTSPAFPPESPTIAHIRTCIGRLNSILGDESRGPAPHPCHTHAATSQVYLTVSKLALASCDPTVISATALLFNTLIEAEVDGIIDSRLFARAVVDLVRRAGFAGEEGEGRLVELIFGVANNIRLQPEILPAWFAPKDQQTDPEQPVDESHSGDAVAQEFAGATRKDDFPLFYLLVDYVHREGRTGDFARTGVLYIIETASRSRDLERWLIESDLATLMATGLGAQYSQLNRSSYAADADNVPDIVALSDHAHTSAALHPESEEHVNAFLTYLLFWQDAIDYCKSVEVNDTLLDHFQVLFLEQLLYPSLLESSDVDGGSTSAVTMYLAQILESIDQPGLVHRILHFLLASPSGDEVNAQKGSLDKKSPMYSSRRKSLDLLAMFADAAPKPSPTLFSLVDLVLISIKSKNPRTVTATLKLVSVIVQRHPLFLNLLFKTMLPLQAPQQKRTIGAFNTELQSLMGLATSIMDNPSLDQSYESYLSSASMVVRPRAHLQLDGAGDDTANTPFTLEPSDAVFDGILGVLARFFTNSVMTNLFLTSAITALVSCSRISLDGWLLVPPGEYQRSSNPKEGEQKMPGSSSDAPQAGPQQDETKDTDSRSTDGEQNGSKSEAAPFAAYEQPQWPPQHVPALSSILQELIHQVDDWRREIPNFDVLLAARKDILMNQGEGSANDAESLAPATQPASSGPGSVDGASSGRPSTPPRGRNTSILERMGTSPNPTARSMSAAPRKPTDAKSAGQSVSRPQSHTRSAQVVKDLRRRLIVNNMRDTSSPHRVAELSLTPSDTASIDTSAPTSDAGDETRQDDSPQDGGGDGAKKKQSEPDVTLGHILTNAVILYEFILELTALVQVRASVLEEVTYVV